MDGAKTAGELYGRVLVVFAAQHYANDLVLARSQRRSSALPHSHKDAARKAFERVTKDVLPAAHTQLQRALEREARSYAKRELAAAHAQELARPAAASVIDDETPAPDEHGADVDSAEDDVEY